MLQSTNCFFILCFAVFIASLAIVNMGHAQIGDVGQVSVKVAPQFPAPSQKVTVSLASFGLDLTRASIIWTINGKAALSGKGEVALSFTAGAAGETVKVAVSITPQGGNTLTRSVSIVPGEVDLIWEVADSYTPPFYRGKALPSSESQIKAVAIPNMKKAGVKLKPETMVYGWKRNYKAEVPSSGPGRNAFVFKGGYTETEEVVEVTASAGDGGVSAVGRTTLEIGEPLVALYENRPLEGMHYEEAIPTEFRLDNEEINVVAEPYFFSAGGGKSDLSFSWLLNSEAVPGDEGNPNALTLRVPQGAGGRSLLHLSVAHLRKFLQTRDANVVIRFSGN